VPKNSVASDKNDAEVTLPQDEQVERACDATIFQSGTKSVFRFSNGPGVNHMAGGAENLRDDDARSPKNSCAQTGG
jgi:hypothetical protein